MAKTVYSQQSVELILNSIVTQFSKLGIKANSFRVLPTGTENRFSLIRQSTDGSQVAQEVSASSLRRLQEQMFSAQSLGLLVGCRPSAKAAFAFAEILEKEEEEARQKAEEDRLAREAERLRLAEQEATLEGAGVTPDLLSKLRGLTKEQLDALFDKADKI